MTHPLPEPEASPVCVPCLPGADYDRASLFRLRDTGALVPVPCSPTVAACLRQIELISQHKERFVVQLVNAAGDTTLQVYQVKRQSKPTYHYRNAFEAERIHQLYVEHLHSIHLAGLDQPRVSHSDIGR